MLHLKKSVVLFLLSLAFFACTDYVQEIDTQIDRRGVYESAWSEGDVIRADYAVQPRDVFGGTLEDLRDGKVYRTVTIGSQTWMAENLNHEIDDSYCYDDDPANCEKFGRLYTWAAAMDSACNWSENGKGCGKGALCLPRFPVRGVCPEGWHLPSSGEWSTLLRAVSNNYQSIQSDTGWYEERKTDVDYGFAILAGGGKTIGGKYYYEGTAANFWVVAERSADETVGFSFRGRDNFDFMMSYIDKSYGYSVRCLKDVTDEKPQPGSSAGEQDVDENPQSSSSIDESSVSCEQSDLWCKDNDYRVNTGMDEYDDDSGYWWVEDDHIVDGASEIEWPVPRGNDYTELAFDPVIDYCKGLCGTAHLVKGGYYLNPFVSIGFDIPGAPVDVSDWGGVCITYMVQVPASLVLRLDPDKEASLSSDLPTVSLSKDSSATEKCFAWSDFKQGGWSTKEKISGSEAAKILRGIAFKIQNKDGTTAEFNIIRLRKAGVEREAELTSSSSSSSSLEEQSSSSVESSSSFEYIDMEDSRNGKVYKAICIPGSQCWMAENINYEMEGSYCYDDADSNCTVYGRLYTWESAKKVCPAGWHLPSKGEYDDFVEVTGEKFASGKALKASCDNGWRWSGCGSDSYGFTALPAGIRTAEGSYKNLYEWAFFWSDTEYDSESAYYMDLSDNDDNAYVYHYGKVAALSVRCVMN